MPCLHGRETYQKRKQYESPNRKNIRPKISSQEPKYPPGVPGQGAAKQPWPVRPGQEHRCLAEPCHSWQRPHGGREAAKS